MPDIVTIASVIIGGTGVLMGMTYMIVFCKDNVEFCNQIVFMDEQNTFGGFNSSWM